MTRRRSGFALMAALWLVVLVGVTGYELSVRSRARRLAVANALETVQANAAAEAALETADAGLALLLKRQSQDPWDDLRGFRVLDGNSDYVNAEERGVGVRIRVAA